MARERDLKVCQASLRVDVSECAHAIDNEAVVLYRRLEALQAVPYSKMVQRMCGPYIARTYRSC